VRKNIIFERACFNNCYQLQSKSVKQLITEVHRLAEYCKFGMMKDELIRDRLVVGIRDNSLSERLQMEAELTLDKAKCLIRQWEVVKEQQEALRDPEFFTGCSKEATSEKKATTSSPNIKPITSSSNLSSV